MLSTNWPTYQPKIIGTDGPKITKTTELQPTHILNFKGYQA